jgi:hypothetical protein
MAQNEVFEYLRNQRLKGNDEFISINEIYRGMIDMQRADAPCRRRVWHAIQQLRKFGYLEVSGVGGWPSYMRLKAEYVDKSTKSEPLTISNRPR